MVGYFIDTEYEISIHQTTKEGYLSQTETITRRSKFTIFNSRTSQTKTVIPWLSTSINLRDENKPASRTAGKPSRPQRAHEAFWQPDPKTNEQNRTKHAETNQHSFIFTKSRETRIWGGRHRIGETQTRERLMARNRRKTLHKGRRTTKQRRRRKNPLIRSSQLAPTSTDLPIAIKTSPKTLKNNIAGENSGGRI